MREWTILVQVSILAEFSMEDWTGVCWNGIWPRPTGCMLMEAKSEATPGPASWTGMAMAGGSEGLRG